MAAALHDCCGHPDARLMSFDEARQAALALARPLRRIEHVPLAEATGRVLAEAIRAPRSLPPFDQAAMDGYALALSGRERLPLDFPICGRTHAGDAPGVLAPGTAHRVMTGAALPDGASVPQPARDGTSS